MTHSDPSISFHDSDDPDSRALKNALGIVFWPGPAGLFVAGLSVLLFDLDLAVRPFWWLVAIWLGAHVMFRPTKVGEGIAALLGAVRDFFGAASGMLAGWIAPWIAKLNAMARSERPAPAPSAPLAPLENNSLLAKRRPESAAPFDWSAFARAAMNPRLWGLLAVSAIVVSVAKGCDGLGFGRSGREVAANAERNQAKAETRTAEAETTQRESVVIHVEALAAARAEINQQTEAARDAINQAPDLDAGFAAYADYAQRMRERGAEAIAAAVSDYRAGLGA